MMRLKANCPQCGEKFVIKEGYPSVNAHPGIIVCSKCYWSEYMETEKEQVIEDLLSSVSQHLDSLKNDLFYIVDLKAFDRLPDDSKILLKELHEFTKKDLSIDEEDVKSGEFDSDIICLKCELVHTEPERAHKVIDGVPLSQCPRCGSESFTNLEDFT